MKRTLTILLVILAATVVAAGCRRRSHTDTREVVKYVQAPNPPPGGQPGPDLTPPAVTADLSVTGTTPTSASLTWTATGDDGYVGTAAAYDVRYSDAPITSEADFDAATEAAGEPVPSIAGSPETMDVTGLLSSTTFWFAMKTIDENGNASPMSNVVQGTTLPPPDVTPPDAIVDLAVVSTNSVSAALQWTAPGDDGMTGTASRYDLRYSTTPIVDDADFDAATQVVGEPVPAPSGEIDQMVVNGLSPGTDYWFAIKTLDEVPNTSALSNVATGSTPPLDVTAPEDIDDLAVTAVTHNSVTLSWTAPGDDGAVGTAAAYDIRMSASAITTDAEFDAAMPVAAWYVPSPAGTPEVLVLNGLWASTTYWFAIKTRDEVPNTSGLSNSPSGTTDPPPDVVPPEAVDDLAVAGWTDHSLTLTWTAPGDDGSTGIATVYDLRMSQTPITSDAEFDAAMQVPGLPVPQIAGTTETFVVDGLPAGALRYFALKTADEIPNWSTLSNLPSGTTSALTVHIAISETEPNNSGDQADPLPVGTPGRGHLDTFSDVDFWSFTASAGDIITVELFGTRMTQAGWSALDSIPILRLLDSGLNELIRHDRSAWLDGSHDLDIPLFRIPADGTYYLRLQASNGTAIREYAALVRLVPMTVVPEAEAPGDNSNGSFGSAEFVAGPATVHGWHQPGDSDFFRFQVRAGDVIRLGIVAYRNGVVQASGYFNPRLWLYDPFGHKVEKVSSTVFHDVEIAFFAPLPGTYAVRVLEDGGCTGQGPYFLNIESAPAPDTWESEFNNSPATADPIVHGRLVKGFTSLIGGPDYFSFSGTAGDMVRIEVFDVVNSTATWRQLDFEVRGSDGVTVVSGAAPEGSFNTFRCILANSGTHYVRVATGGVLPAFYAFRLVRFKEATWEGEPNDDPAAPGALDTSGRAAGVIGTSNDVDAFGFSASQSELVTIGVYAGRALVPPGSDGDSQRSGWGSTLSPLLVVRDAGGIVLAVSQNGLAYVSAESVTNPLPTLEVSFVAPATGSYTVTVESATGSGDPTKTYVLQRR